jgi:cell wall-associated NlpC family hydrolase
VQYVFAKHGTRLPRTSRQQASSGQRLRPVWSALRPGDLVLFAEPGRHISHVAIYAGRRRIIHATSSGGRVRYDALDTKRGKWFVWHLVAARRVSPRGASLVFSDGSADRWSGP